MKKTISVKPVTEIELEFSNDKSLTLKFDIRALMNLREMHDFNTITDEPIPEVCAMLIASSSITPITLEETRLIVSDMDLSTITAIMSEWGESLGGYEDEASKKLTAKFLNAKMSK